MLHNCIFHNLFNKILPNKPTGSVIPNRGNLKELFLGEAMGDSPIWSEMLRGMMLRAERKSVVNVGYL